MRMVLISTAKGLNLSFKDKPSFATLLRKETKFVSLDLSGFTHLHLKPLISLGDTVCKGEPIAHDVHDKSRIFLSTSSGTLKEILRGDRRKIIGLVLEVNEKEEKAQDPIDLNLSKEQLMEELFQKGLSFSIRKRPFNRIISKTCMPRSIFIHTVVSAPYSPSYIHILKGNEGIFQSGIELLAKFGNVHLVCNEKEFENFNSCSTHKIKGKHPIESPSVHIRAIDPINAVDDIVWSVNVNDVLHLGGMTKHGRVFGEKIVAFAGPGFTEEERCLVKTLKGANLNELTAGKENLISGDPLTGMNGIEFLRDKDNVVTCFNKETKTEILPFVKPGFTTRTQTKTYLWGLLGKNRSFSPTYKLNGEERPFILKDIYQDHLPLNIYLEPLLKALLAKNYDGAISLGFLDLDTDDLALAQYLCPSKLPLMQMFENAKVGYLQLNEK